jgi:UDP-glucose 4-epimerase
MVIPIFLKQKSEGKPLTIVGDGTKTRDYVFVSDVVDANIKALHSSVTDGTVINIGSGRQISVNEIAALIGGSTQTLPPRIGEMQFIEADNKRAAELLGWKPTVAFEDGLQKAAAYFGVTLS